MSNHFTGLSLGPPLSDQRLDLGDLDPSRPAAYPNGLMFAEDVINERVAFLTKNEAPPAGLTPHTETLGAFPYLGNPHPAK